MVKVKVPVPRALLQVSAVTRMPIRTLASSSSSRQRLASSDDPTLPENMTWPTYLQLRRSQRYYGLFASIPTTFLGLSLGGNYFAGLEAEPGTLIMGVDPIWAYGAATLGCVALGWLSGPVVGSQVWRMTHQSSLTQMEAWDKKFYEHVKRNRVDPSRQSVSNPVPDYYCEKVGNLKQYRQWLRDQAAYRRKAQFGEGNEAAS